MPIVLDKNFVKTYIEYEVKMLRTAQTFKHSVSGIKSKHF